MGRSIAYQPDRESQGQTEMIARKASAEQANEAYLRKVYDIADEGAERAGLDRFTALKMMQNGVRV